MKNKKIIMKRGFLTGLLAFVIAKVAHLLITGCIGLILGLTFGNTSLEDLMWDLISIVDNPGVGLIFLIFATRYIYRRLVSQKITISKLGETE
tara:strand:- start:6 stop:284 length:279 start_codon:yes stop_codon:yes gene_type:complete